MDGGRTIHHVPAIAGTKSYGSIVIRFGHVLADPGEHIFNIDERVAAPILVDGIGKSLAVACRACDIRCDDNEALLSEHSRIPSRRPAITPSSLWTTMNEVCDRIFLRFVKVARLDDPGVHFFVHIGVAGWRPDGRDLVCLQAKLVTVVRV